MVETLESLKSVNLTMEYAYKALADPDHIHIGDRATDYNYTYNARAASEDNCLKKLN